VADNGGDNNYVRNGAGEYLAVTKTVKEVMSLESAFNSFLLNQCRAPRSRACNNINEILAPVHKKIKCSVLGWSTRTFYRLWSGPFSYHSSSSWREEWVGHV